MNRYTSRGSLGLVCAAAALACGGSAAPPPLPGDAVWCDVQAFGCGEFSFDQASGSNADVGCKAPTSAPIPVSPPIVGGRVCVEHGSTTAVAACASVCNALAANTPQIELAYPKGAQDCVATVNVDSSHVYDSAQFSRSSCSLPRGSVNRQLVETSDPTTHAARLGGTGSVSYAGASQKVGVVSGYLNLAAPHTACSWSEIACFVRINQLELKLGNFSVSGKLFEGLTLYSRESFVTGSGQFAASVNRFIFTLPSGVEFDAVAKVDNAQSGFAVVSDQEVFASVDLATGEVDFQYSLRGSFAGEALTIDGDATTVQVVGRAPVIIAPAALSLDATTSCSVPVSLRATVASPLDLPTFPRYFIDDTLVGDSPSVTVDLPVGNHTAKIVAWDSLGEFASATQSITVNDQTQRACQAE
ncbi:MAG TPA: hypothetical protein VGC79_31945 [Polyangiaceae bacterium]